MKASDIELSEMDADTIYQRYHQVPMWQTSVFIKDYIASVGDQIPDILQRLNTPTAFPERTLTAAFREEQHKLRPCDRTDPKCMANVIFTFLKKTGTNISDFAAMSHDPEEAARKLAEERQLYLAKLATDTEERAIIKEANAARIAAYTGPRKIVLVIDAHGAFIVDSVIEPTHTVDPDYYNRVNFAIESPLSTCAWGDVLTSYNIIKKNYENYPGDDTFDFTRNQLRPITAASMERTKNSIIEGSVDYNKNLTPRTRRLHKSYILHNIAVEQANALTAANIVGERNYWASYSLDLAKKPITKLYTFDLKHKGIYVAAAYGMPEITNPQMSSHNLIDVLVHMRIEPTPEFMELQLAVVRGKITLTQILQCLCVAGIEVDIFDCTCSTLRTNKSDTIIYVSTDLTRRLSPEGKGKTRKKRSKKKSKKKSKNVTIFIAK